MNFEVAKTIVFDREQSIRVAEMRRIAAARQSSADLADRREGLFAQIARLIQIRPQSPAPLTGLGGAAA